MVAQEFCTSNRFASPRSRVVICGGDAGRHPTNAILWLDLPDGVCTDIWLSDGAAIEAETEQWARREWTGVRQGGRPAPIHALEWLGDEESRRIGAAFIDPGTDESQA